MNLDFRCICKIAKSDRFVMSLNLSMCPSSWNSLAPTGWSSMKFDILEFVKNLSRKLVSLKSDKNNRYFM